MSFSTIYFGFYHIPSLVVTESETNELELFMDLQVSLSVRFQLFLSNSAQSSIVSLAVAGPCHSDFEFKTTSAVLLLIRTPSLTCRVRGS